jgi:glycosidase
MTDNRTTAETEFPFYSLEPDYDRGCYEIPEKTKIRILEKLAFLYGDETAAVCFKELDRIIKVHYAHKPRRMIEMEEQLDPRERFTEKDIILITYGDLIQDSTLRLRPLQVLREFAHNYLKGAVNTVHILPFFPHSSDRGFSIIDFEEVDPKLGSWKDIEELKGSFELMFDGVFNHVSAKSRWFQEFLNGNPQFLDFFITFSTKGAISEDHLKLIVRPRISDLLTSFSTLCGHRSVWTTFSEDQIDLNFKNPDVLLKMISILLLYVRKGADIIRLDAVTYLWSELGTSCVHLEQTHMIIKLFRDIMEAVARSVALITETNVPHDENIQYFGNGSDEAHMVYNFALPPLVLHSFQTGSAHYLTEWAAQLEKFSDTTTYFNFLDSHDGIGVTPIKNILTEEEIQMMALRVLEHGGFISYKDAGNGKMVPYELNITWYSAMNRMDSEESQELQVKRFLASRAIALAMMGVPGVYIHSLLGSKNDADAVVEEEQNRSINRKTIDRESLYQTLKDKETSTYKIVSRFSDMLRKRSLEKAFHPNGPQRVLRLSDSLFSILRTSVDGNENILAITNITDQKQDLKIEPGDIGINFPSWLDILRGRRIDSTRGKLDLTLKPYEILWLKQG